MKSALVVRVVAKSHVVVIALSIYFAASGAAIAEPGTVEAPTLPPRNERPEVLNSGLDRCEAVAKKVVDVIRPLGLGRVDGRKLENDSGAEGCAGSGAAATVSGAITKPSNEASKQDGAKYGIGVIYESIKHSWWLYVVVFVTWLIVWPFASDPWGGAKNPFLKHNA